MSLRLLATRFTDLPLDAVPQPVLDAARRATVDTLAVAVAGRDEPAARLAARWATWSGPSPMATLWGHHDRVSPAEAAFANATSGHALDFDDTLPSARAHASVVVAAAGLAVAASQSSTVGAYLAAFAMGVETVHRLGRSLGHTHYERGWHATSTVGAFGAATTAARLWGLDAQQLRTAWGAAASFASGLIRNFGTDLKPMHAGLAARAGIHAAWLAQEGATASTDPWAGSGGVVDAYGGASETLDLADGWALIDPGCSVKRWPCCFASHRAIAGLEALLAAGSVRPEQVDRIEVSFLPGSDSALAHARPTNGLEAKFSVEYPLAALLLDGRLDVASFDDEAVSRPEAQALLQRVVRVPEAADRRYSGSAADGHTDVTLVSDAGRRSVRIDRVPGAREWPLSEREFREKVVGCLAPRWTTRERAGAWFDRVGSAPVDSPVEAWIPRPE